MSNSEVVFSARILTRDRAIWPQIATSGEKKEKIPTTHTQRRLSFKAGQLLHNSSGLDFTPSASQAGREQSTAGTKSQHFTAAQYKWSTQGAPAHYQELHAASL